MVAGPLRHDFLLIAGLELQPVLAVADGVLVTKHRFQCVAFAEHVVLEDIHGANAIFLIHGEVD